jgi:hypothetical protein
LKDPSFEHESKIMEIIQHPEHYSVIADMNYEFTNTWIGFPSRKCQTSQTRWEAALSAGILI